MKELVDQGELAIARSEARQAELSERREESDGPADGKADDPLFGSGGKDSARRLFVTAVRNSVRGLVGDRESNATFLPILN